MDKRIALYDIGIVVIESDEGEKAVGAEVTSCDGLKTVAEQIGEKETFLLSEEFKKNILDSVTIFANELGSITDEEGDRK